MKPQSSLVTRFATDSCRDSPPSYASCPKSVNALPSAYARLRLVPCSWQNSRREILKAKSPSLSSTVNVERRGNRASNTLTGADGLYNGRSVSRQNQPPITNSFEIRRVCASAIVGQPITLLAFCRWTNCEVSAPSSSDSVFRRVCVRQRGRSVRSRSVL
jgi:hypothetical protein